MPADTDHDISSVIVDHRIVRERNWEMGTACVKHPMTVGDHVCSGCGHSFCRECIVRPFGADKPGLCIGCALERGGVRARSAAWPRLPKRTIRQRLRESRDRIHEANPTPEVGTDRDPVSDDTRTAEPWLGDDSSLDDIPGAWSEVYR